VVKKIMVFGVVTMLILGVAAVAVAAPGAGLGLGRSPITQLDLTDDQYSKLQELHKEYYEEKQTLMSQIRDINFNLKSLYLQKDPDEKAIEAQQNKAESLKDQMIQLRDKQHNDVSKILTVEQQEKLEELRGPGLGRGAGGNHRGGFGGGYCHGFGQGRGMGMMGRY
jgi:Spy/CpxP family protein refolding chaperone